MLTRDELIERLSSRGSSELVDHGALIVPVLIDIMVDDPLSMEDSPGNGLAPVNAAHTLGELRAEAAVEPMLRRLASTGWEDILHDAIIQALPRFGAAVVEPALRLHAECDDDEVRSSVEAVLAKAGVRDDRIFGILLARLAQEPGYAGCLASYGDPRALEPLSRAFDAYEVDDDDRPLANHELVELRAAIEDPGGTLTIEQDLKFAVAMEPARRWRRRMSQSPVARAQRPGRNEPCWCGSAKKYKRCHLDSDAAESSARP